MGKKKIENRYGVQVGDIFYWNVRFEDGDAYAFYQVIALRGETQVAVRRISHSTIAFDRFYEGVVPLPDAWISDEVLVRKVHEGSGITRSSIRLDSSWLSFAHLDRKEMYIVFPGKSLFCELLEEYQPELAKQLDLKNGSGVFAKDRLFKTIDDDCKAVIHYPNGREQEAILKELLCYEEHRKHQEQIDLAWAEQNREK